VVTFGKHKGFKIADVPTGYLRWVAETFGPGKWRDAFAAELARRAQTEAA
jgi:uncharacterized protein (DUF3820 family)